jgi:hypothetical protein
MSLVASDMAQAMVDQLDEAWQIVKGEPFPGGSREDARIMFLAVARGLLVYMEAHQNDMVNTVTLSGGSAQTVTAIDLNIPPLPPPPVL